MKLDCAADFTWAPPDNRADAAYSFRQRCRSLERFLAGSLMSLTVDVSPEPMARVNGATTALIPYTRLQVAPGLQTRFDASGHVLVESPDGTLIDVGPHGFATLSLFSRPVALGDLIATLEASEREFLPTISVINTLIEEGALIEPEGDGRPTTGWADPVEHARMLHDSRRTSDYVTALTAAVRPGDVVLDIGTGSGVLAVAAALAGARRVYAVEATDIADVARQVFAANGVQDRVMLIPGWSRQVELPEPADVLVAEVIGSEPLAEEILETTLDARRRLLKRQARLVPNALTVLVRPLRIPDAEARLHVIESRDVERWQRLYGIDLQPLHQAASPVPAYTSVDCEIAAAWPPVGPSVALAAIDLTTFKEVGIRASADLTFVTDATVNAIAMTFRADLHGPVAHTLDPWRWPSSSWATSVWVLPEPVEVGPGSTLRVRYSRRTAGKADGLRCEVVESQSEAETEQRQRLEVVMGFVRRRTRRRTMLLAGGAAYAAGRAANRVSDEPQEEEYASAPPPPAPSEASDVDELQRLADMHTAGTLTDEEFAAEKAKILGT